jgi:hypothetical protein
MSQGEYGGSYGASGYEVAPPTNTKATVSLIAGIAGVALGLLTVCVVGPCSALFSVIGGVVGLITGYQAKREIAESAGTQGGEGQAKAGIILGWVNVALTLLLILLSILGVAGIIGLGLMDQWAY